ncbi:MAG TPA: OsmC family protein [Dissulfurispiraceae bacterium]|nr:OsmC family protein [Dissulfurispiraceae bacterium]
MMQANVRWVQGLQFVGKSGTNHEIQMDADAEYGGTDKGMRPMEMLLVAIGGCTGMDVTSILQKKRQQLNGIEIRVSGTNADTHPMKFTVIELEYIITGKDIPEAAVKKAIEASMEKYCSVKATLEGVAKINYRYTIVNA